MGNINGWNMSLYTREDVYEVATNKIADLSHHKLLMATEESVWSFLRRCHSDIKENKVDLVIYLTVQDMLPWLALSRFTECNTLVTVHNARAWATGNETHRWRYRLKQFLRKWIAAPAKGYVVNSQNMADYMRDNQIDKRVFVMPFSLETYQGVPRSLSTDRIKIVYPGMVNTDRKRYDDFIRLASRFPSIDFYLLGKIKPEKEETLFTQLKAFEGDNLHFYTEFVATEDFDEVMKAADFIYSDVVTDFRVADFREVYGHTKDSGVSYLIQQYGAPGILNRDFANLPHLNEGTFYFKNINDLVDLLSDRNKLSEQHWRWSVAIQKGNESISLRTQAEELKLFIEEL